MGSGTRNPLRGHPISRFTSALRSHETPLTAQPDPRPQPADGDGGHPGRDPRRPGSTSRSQHQRWQFLVLALALMLTFLLNTLLLRRRFEPLERLLAMMERVDLSRPGRRLEIDPEMPGVSTDIQRLAASLQPHAGAARERAPPLGRAGPAARRRRSASASRATCTTRSTSRSRRCCCASRRPPRTPRRTLKAQLDETKAARRPGDGRAARPRPPAAPHRARRPRPRRGARDPRARLRPPRAGARQLLGGPPPGRAVARRPGGRLPGRAGGARECRPPLGRRAASR